MIPSRTLRRAALPLLGALLLAASAARADSFLGGDYTTGAGYRGFDAKGGLGLDKEGAWEADATYSYAHSHTGTESRSRELVLTLVNVADDSWTSRVGATGWRDNLNDVTYFGPSYGFTYTAYADPSAKEKKESWSASFDNDVFIYKADETTSPKTVRLTRKASIVIPGNQSAVSLAQWHPYAHVEAPFGPLTPSLDYAHYFYSKNPALIEARAGRPNFSSSAGSLNGLVGGLNSDSGAVGLSVKLPLGVRVNGSVGLTRSATDNSWSTAQGAGLSFYIGDDLKPAASWARTIQAGVASDLVTAGASFYF